MTDQIPTMEKEDLQILNQKTLEFVPITEFCYWHEKEKELFNSENSSDPSKNNGKICQGNNNKEIDNLWDLYKYDSIIGNGASCHVMSGIRLTDHKKVAIKEIKSYKNLNMPNKELINFEQFENEYKTLLKLSHSKLLTILDVYKTEKHYYIVTDYLQGTTLTQMILNQKNEKTTEIEIVYFVKQILECVAVLHKHGYAHRDIKSDNFVFRDIHNRELVLIDFGDCKLIEENGFLSDFVGSIMYLAPESFRPRRELELFASDIWAIGILVYQLICKNTPFYGNTHRAIISQILKIGKDDFKLVFKKFIDKTVAATATATTATTENNNNNKQNGDSNNTESKNNENKENKNNNNNKPTKIDENDMEFEEIKVSDECLDFVSKCLKYYSKDRMTIDECLEHPWIIKNFGRSPMIGTPSCSTHQKSSAFVFPVDDMLTHNMEKMGFHFGKNQGIKGIPYIDITKYAINPKHLRGYRKYPNTVRVGKIKSKRNHSKRKKSKHYHSRREAKLNASKSDLNEEIHTNDSSIRDKPQRSRKKKHHNHHHHHHHHHNSKHSSNNKGGVLINSKSHPFDEPTFMSVESVDIEIITTPTNKANNNNNNNNNIDSNNTANVSSNSIHVASHDGLINDISNLHLKRSHTTGRFRLNIPPSPRDNNNGSSDLESDDSYNNLDNFQENLKDRFDKTLKQQKNSNANSPLSGGGNNIGLKRSRNSFKFNQFENIPNKLRSHKSMQATMPLPTVSVRRYSNNHKDSNSNNNNKNKNKKKKHKLSPTNNNHRSNAKSRRSKSKSKKFSKTQTNSPKSVMNDIDGNINNNNNNNNNNNLNIINSSYYASDERNDSETDYDRMTQYHIHLSHDDSDNASNYSSDSNFTHLNTLRSSSHTPRNKNKDNKNYNNGKLKERTNSNSNDADEIMIGSSLRTKSLKHINTSVQNKKNNNNNNNTNASSNTLDSTVYVTDTIDTIDTIDTTTPSGQKSVTFNEISIENNNSNNNNNNNQRKIIEFKRAQSDIIYQMKPLKENDHSSPSDDLSISTPAIDTHMHSEAIHAPKIKPYVNTTDPSPLFWSTAVHIDNHHINKNNNNSQNNNGNRKLDLKENGDGSITSTQSESRSHEHRSHDLSLSPMSDDDNDNKNENENENDNGDNNNNDSNHSNSYHYNLTLNSHYIEDDDDDIDDNHSGGSHIHDTNMLPIQSMKASKSMNENVYNHHNNKKNANNDDEKEASSRAAMLIRKVSDSASSVRSILNINENDDIMMNKDQSQSIETDIVSMTKQRKDSLSMQSMP